MKESFISFQGGQKMVVFRKCCSKRCDMCISTEVNPYLASSFNRMEEFTLYQ